MLDLKALPVLRKNLNAFIRADPILVVLERVTKVKTASGGYVTGPVTSLPPQTFRVVPFKRRLYDFTQRTATGKIPTEQFALVGPWTCDIRRDDEFLMGSNRYRVVSLEPQMDEDRTKTDRVVAMLEVQLGDDFAPIDI